MARLEKQDESWLEEEGLGGNRSWCRFQVTRPDARRRIGGVRCQLLRTMLQLQLGLIVARQH